jgi:hypothetical protein
MCSLSYVECRFEVSESGEGQKGNWLLTGWEVLVAGLAFTREASEICYQIKCKPSITCNKQFRLTIRAIANNPETV